VRGWLRMRGKLSKGEREMEGHRWAPRRGARGRQPFKTWIRTPLPLEGQKFDNKPEGFISPPAPPKNGKSIFSQIGGYMIDRSLWPLPNACDHAHLWGRDEDLCMIEKDMDLDQSQHNTRQWWYIMTCHKYETLFSICCDDFMMVWCCFCCSK